MRPRSVADNQMVVTARFAVSAGTIFAVTLGRVADGSDEND